MTDPTLLDTQVIWWDGEEHEITPPPGSASMAVRLFGASVPSGVFTEHVGFKPHGRISLVGAPTVRVRLGGRATLADGTPATADDYNAGLATKGGDNGGGDGGDPVTFTDFNGLDWQFVANGGAGRSEVWIDDALVLVAPGIGGAGAYGLWTLDYLGGTHWASLNTLDDQGGIIPPLEDTNLDLASTLSAAVSADPVTPATLASKYGSISGITFPTSDSDPNFVITDQVTGEAGTADQGGSGTSSPLPTGGGGGGWGAGPAGTTFQWTYTDPDTAATQRVVIALPGQQGLFATQGGDPTAVDTDSPADLTPPADWLYGYGVAVIEFWSGDTPLPPAGGWVIGRVAF